MIVATLKNSYVLETEDTALPIIPEKQVRITKLNQLLHLDSSPSDQQNAQKKTVIGNSDVTNSVVSNPVWQPDPLISQICLFPF